jgi:tetratricopeptide (TPR) repeat protein
MRGTLDRALDDMFAVQDEITGAVSLAIESAAGLHHGRHAVELSRGCWYGQVAPAYAMLGLRRFDESGRALETASLIAPRGRIVRLTGGVLHFMRGDYEQTARVEEALIESEPSYPHSYWVLLASLGQLRAHEKALACMARRLALAPEQVRMIADVGVPWFGPEDRERFMTGFRATGWNAGMADR